MKQYIINTSDRVKEVNINRKNFKIRVMSVGTTKKLLLETGSEIQNIESMLKMIKESFVNLDDLLSHLDCKDVEDLLLEQIEMLVKIIAEVNKSE